MKHLYLLLIFTLSFSVYSQGIFTYNFDDTNNTAGFKTAIDASESSWGGVATADGGAVDKAPAAAGYMGVIGTDADPTLYPGCVDAPGTKTSNAIYSQKYPNTTRPAGQGGPAKSLGLNTGKVHLTVAFQAWKITNGSNNEIEVRLQNSDLHRMISVRVQQHKVSGTPVDDQIRFVGVTYNGTTNGAQKTAGLFPVGSENTTPMVLGATIDFDANTWEFWTDAPGTTAGLVSTNAGLTGTFGDAGTQSIIGQTVDAMTVMVKGNNGADDYFIIDQIKVSGPNYIDTVSDNTADNTSPVITLLGDSVVTVEVGSNYVDAGATASDNVDGDLTASIDTNSDVDTSTVGTYLVTYNVSDTAGNAATEVIRTVNVVETLQSENNIMAVWDFESDSTEISGGTATELTNTNLQWLNSGSADSDANDGAISVDNVATAYSGALANGLNIGDTGKYYFSLALNNWKITTTSGSNFQIRFKTSDGRVVGSIKLEETASLNKTRVVGSLYNSLTSGNFWSAGHFGPESLAYSTPVNIGLTLDFDNDTYEYWTGTPNSPTEGNEFYYDYDGISGNISPSLAGVTIDHIQLNAVLGSGDSFTIDQIKISREESEENEVDTIAPVITLMGDETVTVQLGSTYVDDGATANDNYDGDLTASIITTSNVDTSKVGTYTITYNVSDAAGNAAPTVVRTVIVESSSTSTTSPITFDEAWTVNGTDWTIKEDQGSNVSIETAGDGNKYLQVVYNDSGLPWQNAQIKLTNAMGQNYFSAGPGKSVTFDLWSDHTGDTGPGNYTGMLKLDQGVDGAPIHEFSFPVSGTGWESVTIDLSTDKNSTEVADGEYGLLVLFTNYGTGNHKKSDTRYYDNITFTDGAVIPGDPAPATAAPTPTHNAADVLNIFSDHYSNTINWYENELRSGWSSGGETKVIDFTVDDKMVKQKSADYIGTYWNAGGSNPRGPINFSNYAYLNLDVWVPAFDGNYSLVIALLSINEVNVIYEIDGGPAGWRTLTIPISDFANSEISSVDGIKFEPNPQGSIPIFYWDNLFAWGDSGDNTNTISVNAGVDVVICEDSSLELNIAGPTATNFVELAWSSSGDGTFDNNNQLTPIYYPGPTDLASGVVNLTLTATGFGQTASDSMTLTFSQSHSLSLISGASTQNQSICEGDDIIPIIYSFGDGASSARVIGLPPGIGYTINENVLTISGALNEDISEPKIYDFVVETIAGDNDCTIVVMTGFITINPSYECNNNSAKILLNGPVHVTSVDGLILTADDGKCYRLKIIQGSSIELVEVNCE